MKNRLPNIAVAVVLRRCLEVRTLKALSVNLLSEPVEGVDFRMGLLFGHSGSTSRIGHAPLAV